MPLVLAALQAIESADTVKGDLDDFKRGDARIDELFAPGMTAMAAPVQCRREAIGVSASRIRACDCPRRACRRWHLLCSRTRPAHAIQIAMVMPPSATSVWPVMKPEASLDRNTAAPARSWGVPQRCMGVRLRIHS